MIKVPSHLDAVIGAGGTLVTPTRQRAHAVRLAHAAQQLEQGRRVWPSPDVLPLEGWLTRALEGDGAEGLSAGLAPPLLRPVQEWLLWRECAEAAAAHLDLVNRGALAEGLLAASRLAAELDVDLNRLRAAPQTETALLLEVYRAVAERTRALGASTLDEALRAGGPPGDARPVALSGFLSLTPRLRALEAERRARGWETLCSAPEAPLSTPEVICAADEREELDRIAGWCVHRLRGQPEGRLLVVLPGSLGRCERLAALIDQGLDAPAVQAGRDGVVAALEGGTALERQPAVAQALAALGLLGGQSVPLPALLEWLRSPFWHESAAARAELDLWLRERAPPALDRPTLERLLAAAPSSLAGSIGARITRAGGALLSDSGTPREWSERFHAALEALGWPGGGLDSPGQQTLVRLRELLEEFGQLSAAVGRMARAAALERLHELAARTVYRPAEQDAPVTVTPVLADPVVRYDGIWVAGLHADALPQAPAPDPFVPLTTQLRAGWPAASPAGRLEQARALLEAWRAATANLVLSTPLRAADVALLPSPLLAPWRDAGAPPSAPPLAWLPERVHRPEQLEPWQDVSVPWARARKLPSGTRALELQNACPFRAYAQLRLGCEPLEASEPGIGADLRGRLLHAALQALWSELGDSHALAALGPEQLDARIEACLERSGAAVLAEQSVRPSPPLLARERRRSLRLIRTLCALERERGPFTVRDVERSVSLSLAGVALEMRVDRVDVLADGALAILDYKSGRPVRADWYGERPSHPQLLAYQAALGEAVQALATVHLTAREIGFHGIAAHSGVLPQVEAVKGEGGADPWAARCAAWRTLLEALASEFAHGVARVDPRPHACDYCHLGALCRIGERLESASASEPQEAP